MGAKEFLRGIGVAVTKASGLSAAGEAIKPKHFRDDKLNGTDEESAKLRREVNFNAQCFLIDNTEQLATKNKLETAASPYKNFVMIEDSNPMLVTHEIVARKGVESLFLLTPAQKSLLVPKIQIFKVHYKNADDRNPTEVALHFREHIENSDIVDITKGRSARGDDVALKSFSYELTGKNPAEGGMVSCQLVLFFANANTLVKTDENGVGWRNLMERHTKFSTNNAYNPKYFQIKVVAGWAVPSDPKNVIIDQALRKAIEDSKVVLFLQMKDYDLSFEENGSLKATLNYVGSMEGIMSSPESDILYLSAQGKLAEQVAADVKKRQSLEKKLPNAQDKDTKVPEDNKDVARIAADGSTSVAEQQKASILALQAVDKQIKYSRLINDLQKTGRMFYVDVNQQMIDEFSVVMVRIKEAIETLKAEALKGGKEVDEEKYKAAFAALKEGSRRAKSLEIHHLSKDTETKLFENFQKANVDANKLLTENERKFWVGPITNVNVKKQSKEEVTKAILTSFESKNYVPISSKNSSDRRVHFFFLGDLFELLFSRLTNKGRSDNMGVKVLLGPMSYNDPREPSRRIVCNLADFPISLELFLAWYMNKVVAEQRERYFVGEFLKDVVESLILPTFGEGCFSGAAKQTPLISINMFTVPAFGAGKTAHPFSNMQAGGRYSLSSLKKLPTSDVLNNAGAHKPITDLCHFIYVHVSNMLPHNLKGEYREDIARGIYHFVPSLDRGLVKKLTFSKEVIPYLAESKVYPRDSESGGLNDQQIAMGQFNAKIQMYGNCLFRQGMMVYVDTSRLGLGIVDKKKLLARDLYLGGYYNVTKVRHSFDENNYDTELEARWAQAAYDEADEWRKAIMAGGLGPGVKALNKVPVDAANQVAKEAVASAQKKIDQATRFATLDSTQSTSKTWKEGNFMSQGSKKK